MFTGISVLARDNDPISLDNKRDEIARYLYGRSFYLSTIESDIPDHVRIVFLVEEHYVKAILDRLASGLLFGAKLDERELAEFIRP